MSFWNAGQSRIKEAGVAKEPESGRFVVSRLLFEGSRAPRRGGVGVLCHKPKLRLLAGRGKSPSLPAKQA